MENKNQVLQIILCGESDTVRGTGHLVRALGIAVELCKLELENLKISFLTNNKKGSLNILSSWGLGTPENLTINEFINAQNENWSERQKSELIHSISKLKFSDGHVVLILDGKYKFNEFDLNQIRLYCSNLIFIDNPYFIEANYFSSWPDAIIFPNDFSPKIPEKKILSGEDWLWLNPTLDLISEKEKIYDFSIFMGGSDPSNLTCTALLDIESRFKNQKLKILVILGLENIYLNEIELLKSKLINFEIEIRRSSQNFLESLIASEICLTAFGLTSMELEHLGQPVVLYGHNRDHELDVENYLSHSTRSSISSTEWLNGSEPQKSKRKKRKQIGPVLLKLITSF